MIKQMLHHAQMALMTNLLNHPSLFLRLTSLQLKMTMNRLWTLIIGTLEVSYSIHAAIRYLTAAAWVPGQGVKIDFAALVEILILQLDTERT